MLIRSLWVALSTYSAVPVPQFPWDEDATRYSLCFFPAVGVVCGAMLALWYALCRWLTVGGLLFAAVATALPLLVTGGIHMDGYLDTVDALASHQPREKKLEILKDPHCGAFAVVYCGVYLLLALGLFHELYPDPPILTLCPGFVLSRALSALCAVNLPNARTGGMLAAFTSNIRRGRANGVLVSVALVSCGAMVLWCPAAGATGALCALVWVWGYRRMVLKQFGGVTGDTSGFFLQVCELLLLLGTGLGGLLV